MPNDKPQQTIPEIEDTVDASGRFLNQQPVYNQMINAEVTLNVDGKMQKGVVKQRATGPDGRTVGTYDRNPMLNSCVYEVEFQDGQVREYAANLIGMSMVENVDEDGFTTSIFHGIVDFCKDGNAVAKSDRWVTTHKGQRCARKTTAGWWLKVQWKDGTHTWFPPQRHERVSPSRDC